MSIECYTIDILKHYDILYFSWGLDILSSWVIVGFTCCKNLCPNKSILHMEMIIAWFMQLISWFDFSKQNAEARKKPESILNIKYGISGNRTIGAHPPVMNESTGVDDARQELIFRSAITLQRPVLDPCLAVGFLPLPSNGLRVGQLIKMQWRVERLKDLDEEGVSKPDVSSNKQRTILIPFQSYIFMVSYFSGAADFK